MDRTMEDAREWNEVTVKFGITPSSRYAEDVHGDSLPSYISGIMTAIERNIIEATAKTLKKYESALDSIPSDVRLVVNVISDGDEIVFFSGPNRQYTYNEPDTTVFSDFMDGGKIGQKTSHEYRAIPATLTYDRFLAAEKALIAEDARRIVAKEAERKAADEARFKYTPMVTDNLDELRLSGENQEDRKRRRSYYHRRTRFWA